MLQETHDSKYHCCLIVKYLSQLHKQFIPPIPLVQFNWYCERGGDNDEALTWGRGGGDLIKLFSPKDVYRCSLFFFLALCARSLALASLASSPMFLKRTKRKMTIGNWNVRTLYRSGNIAQLTREITSRKIDIVGISETHWIGKVKVQLENGEAIIYHREETTTITGEWVY